MASLVDDCKLKFNQIKKREKSIDECAKEEGMEDMLASLHEDKIKFNQIITQVPILFNFFTSTFLSLFSLSLSLSLSFISFHFMLFVNIKNRIRRR